MGAKGYIARRAAQSVVTIFVVAVLMFVLFRLMPGDPTAVALSPALDESVQQEMARQYGLNQPLHIQFIRYMASVVTLDFGYSFFQNEPVRDILMRRIGNTLLLMGTGLLLAYAFGTSIGALAAWKRGSFDTRVLVSAVLFRSTPVFWLALVLLYVFGFHLEWFPIGHMVDAQAEYSGFLDKVFSVDFLHHLFLPVLSTVPFYMAYPLLLMRTTMLRIEGEDFITMAHAKGVRDRDVFAKHAARNSLLPIVTTAPIVVGLAVAGNVLVETIYSWPGVGRTLVQAVLQSDYPLAQAAFLMIAVIVIIGNFVADLLYTVIDPRITYD